MAPLIRSHTMNGGRDTKTTYDQRCDDLQAERPRALVYERDQRSGRSHSRRSLVR